jgi:hypothetical protein
VKGEYIMPCNIDHSLEDVKKKLESQMLFLPEELFSSSTSLLKNKPTQDVLNELFHLLKKYDLALEEERLERNKQIAILTQ